MDCDVRLKDMVSSGKWWERYDFAVEEDAKHIILQCPVYGDLREEMSAHINSVKFGSGRLILESSVDVFTLLIGRCVEGYSGSNPGLGM